MRLLGTWTAALAIAGLSLASAGCERDEGFDDVGGPADRPVTTPAEEAGMPGEIENSGDRPGTLEQDRPAGDTGAIGDDAVRDRERLGNETGALDDGRDDVSSPATGRANEGTDLDRPIDDRRADEE
jgi:hypothetical protein